MRKISNLLAQQTRWNLEDVYHFTNTSDSVVDTHLLIIVRGLPAGVQLDNESGTTRGGEPYVRVLLPDGVLQPGQQITRRFVFSSEGRKLPAYAFTLLSGQGSTSRCQRYLAYSPHTSTLQLLAARCADFLPEHAVS